MSHIKDYDGLEFVGRGKYLTVFLPTGRKEKNVIKLQRCIDYYEERNYKFVHFTSTEPSNATTCHYIVFEKAY